MNTTSRKFDGNQMIYASDLQDMNDAIQNAINPLKLSKDKSIITITGIGLLPNTVYTLQLMRRSRKGAKTGKWIKVEKRDGYRYLVDHANFAKEPIWLPDLKNQISVTTDNEGSFNFNIDASKYFLPFIKPAEIDDARLDDTVDPGIEMSLVGLNRKRPYRRLHFTFNLLLNDQVIKNCTDIIAINARKDSSLTCHVAINEKNELYLTGLRVSII